MLMPTFRFPPNNGIYQKVIFSYLDLLGFSNLVENSCKDNPNFLLQILSKADFFTNASFPNTHLERRIISDSILIWSKDLINGILPICNIIRLLQCSLLQEGCLLRGSIVLDNHFSEFIKEKKGSNFTLTLTSDEIIVSPALVKAVKIEKSINYPRVVFEQNKALKDIFYNAKLLNPNFSTHDKCCSIEDKTYIEGFFTSHELLGISGNHSPYILGTMSKEEMAEACREKAIEQLQTIKQKIEVGLSNNDEKIKEKWLDIKCKYNEFVSSCSINCKKELEI